MDKTKENNSKQQRHWLQQHQLHVKDAEEKRECRKLCRTIGVNCMANGDGYDDGYGLMQKNKQNAHK